MTKCAPKIPQIPFAFEFNQLNGNSVDFGKTYIYNFYVYHQSTIQQIRENWPNGNLVVHMKILNIYLFPKWTELPFGGPQIKLKRKWNLSYSECMPKLIKDVHIKIITAVRTFFENAQTKMIIFCKSCPSHCYLKRELQ